MNRKGRHIHGGSAGGVLKPEYRSWLAMRARCARVYKARGITICARWNAYVNFLADMGPMPRDGQRYTVERKDNSKGYNPKNCVWATYKTQSRNKRNNHVIRFRGKTQSLAAWAEQCSISQGALKIRLRNGWSIKAALTTPVPAPRLRDAAGKFSVARGRR